MADFKWPDGGSGGGGASWGSITGTLSNQTDLQTALNGKQATGNYITSLTGEATASGPGAAAVTLSNAAVIGKVITGYVSGAGVITAADTILSAIEKLDGNQTAIGMAITALTGDGTATGPGSAALTLATVNSNVGSFGSASSVGTFTVNAKGLVTAAGNSSIAIAQSQVTNLVTDLAGKQPTGNYITALTGDVTASGPGSVAASISDATVTGKLITGYVSGAGVVAATDTILQAINKLDGNTAAKQPTGNYITALTGDVTASGPGSASASISDATVTGKLITGFVSGAGTVAATDTVLQAINKLDGNTAGKQPTGNYITALTGDVTASGPGSASATISDTTVTGKLLTGFVATPGVVSATDSILDAIEKLAAGSGGTGINYIGNSAADVNTSGWATYADAAGAVPVNGTGGSPTVTFTRSTSSPLRGVGSFVLTKDAADRQGEGVSYDFTIADADLAQPLTVSMEYQPTSGFVSSSGQTGSLSDVVVYLYDVTNSVVIQPTPFVLTGGIANPNKFSTQFQTNSDSNSYRLIFHVATTNATAWTLKIDDVVCGPQTALYGSPISDPIAYTPVLNSNTNVNDNEANWVRVGNKLRLQSWVTYTGVGDASVFTVALPPGLSIDMTALTLTTEITVGSALWFDSGTALVAGNAVVVSPTTIGVVATGGTNTFLSSAFANGDQMSLLAEVPIVGWSSNVVMSQDAETRVVSATVDLSADFAVSANAPIEFDSVIIDTHSAYNAATGLYTVPVAGYYRVSTSVFSASGSTAYIGVNGNNYGFLTAALPVSTTQGGSKIIQCSAGDTVGVYIDTAVTITGQTPAVSTISIERLSGPAAIAASESIVAAYSLGTGASLPSGSPTKVPFDTKQIDTHGAFDTTNNRFVAPASGAYLVSGTISTEASTNTFTAWRVSIYKNGSEYRTIQSVKLTEINTVNCSAATTYSLQVPMLAGDYVEIFAFQNSGGTETLMGDDTPIYGCSINVMAI